jgi:hypothetical protein
MVHELARSLELRCHFSKAKGHGLMFNDYLPARAFA